SDEQITQIDVIFDDSDFQAGRHRRRLKRISSGKACKSLQPQLEHHGFLCSRGPHNRPAGRIQQISALFPFIKTTRTSAACLP
ncbi:MAG: hypothetical protein NT083_08805, partial [Rhodocyclales bacterium]|nr:hypothetical protein [Rhodocyclales bacterium]